MKKMKMYLMTAMLGVASLSMVFTSCNTDECKDVVCENGGLCNADDGSCDCPAGYEGTSCETMSKTKFLKNWSASDVEASSPSNPLIYTCVIADGADLTSVIVSDDFSDDYFVNNISATVSGDIITIPNQQPDNDGYAVAGTGTYNSTTGNIAWNYTITEIATVSTLSYTGSWN